MPARAPGELGDRQPVQAQAQHIVGLLGSLDHLLQLGEDVAVQVTEEHPVDVQSICAAEADGSEEGEDVLQWPQHPRRPLANGVASGRVTSSATTFGCVSANRRNS